MAPVRPAVLFLISIGLLWAQPAQIKFDCTPQDIDAFGLNCTDDRPCPVFAELTAAAIAGKKMFVAGNLHTSNTTLYSLLLASDDDGLTWTEPTPRQSNAAFEQLLFIDANTGWASGEAIDPLPRNQFVMLTTDAGKTWKQRFLFEDEPKFGAVTQLSFSSPNSGELVLDASQGRTVKQELYGTETGGESWEIRQTSNTPLKLKSPPREPALRIRSDAKTNTHVLERNEGGKWTQAASFPVRVAECK
jgi:hypothetical protein